GIGGIELLGNHPRSSLPFEGEGFNTLQVLAVVEGFDLDALQGFPNQTLVVVRSFQVVLDPLFPGLGGNRWKALKKISFIHLFLFFHCPGIRSVKFPHFPFSYSIFHGPAVPVPPRPTFSRAPPGPFRSLPSRTPFAVPVS